MTYALLLLALLLVAITMGLALAHALELPGKRRLGDDEYRTVQAIYYPGFTIGGLVGELGGILVLAILIFLLPFDSQRFWWTAVALACMLLLHATYWLVTHPANSVWLEETELSGPGAAFFSALTRDKDGRDPNRLRATWEASHVARAGFGIAALLAMAVALSL